MIQVFSSSPIKLAPARWWLLSTIIGIVYGASALAGERIYMNLGWQDSAGVALSLNRAAEIIEQDSEAKIEFLVHGKDIKLFANGDSQRREAIVELGRQLAEQGGIEFKVCKHALVFKNLTLDQLPPYFSTVGYVPDRIKALERQGYTPLQFNSSAHPQ